MSFSKKIKKVTYHRLTSPRLLLAVDLHLKSQIRKDPSLEPETIISENFNIK